MAGAALPACAIEQGRIHGHEVAGPELAHVAAERHDLAAELVARHDRIAGWGELTAQDMDVGPADPARVDFDDDLPRFG